MLPKGRVLSKSRMLLLVMSAVGLASCQSNPLLVQRSACPAVAVPYYAGDLTLFRAGDTQRDASAIDAVATITDVRGVCQEGAESLGTAISFNVTARRVDTPAARSMTLPFFTSVVQGGNLVVSKQQGQVTLNFAAGQARAEAPVSAQATVLRAAATLPAELQARLTRKRKATDLDASIDPLADPEVRAAVRATTFEVLVGFQLDDAALAYNITK